jgi:hypothetical protein
MKRPFQHSHVDDDDDIDKLTTTSSNQPPIVIEVDDCACREASTPLLWDENPCKRARTACDCSSLNLLVTAMEISRTPSDSGLVKVVDRVPSMCHEVAAFVDCRSSSSASGARVDESFEEHQHSPPTPSKAMVYHKRFSSSVFSSRLPPVLPVGRPLMAPPRLPTNLRPGQIMLRHDRQKR